MNYILMISDSHTCDFCAVKLSLEMVMFPSTEVDIKLPGRLSFWPDGLTRFQVMLGAGDEPPA